MREQHVRCRRFQQPADRHQGRRSFPSLACPSNPKATVLLGVHLNHTKLRVYCPNDLPLSGNALSAQIRSRSQIFRHRHRHGAGFSDQNRTAVPEATDQSDAVAYHGRQSPGTSFRVPLELIALHRDSRGLGCTTAQPDSATAGTCSATGSNSERSRRLLQRLARRPGGSAPTSLPGVRGFG